MMTLGFAVTGWSAARPPRPARCSTPGWCSAGVGHGLLLPSIMRIVLPEVAP
jgi:hypothetical protein